MRQKYESIAMGNWSSSNRKPRHLARNCKYPELAYKLEAASVKYTPAWFESWAGFLLAWAVAVLLALFQLGIFGIGVAMIYTNQATLDEGSPDFALYKNSRFRECADITPEQVNCTLLQGNLIDAYPHPPQMELQNHFLMDMTYHDYQGNISEHPTYTWCEMVSCLKDFKVIPTTLRPSALQLPSLKTWFDCNIQAIIGTWAARSTIGSQPRQSPSPCKGMSFLDWAPAVYTIGAALFWWVEFIRWCTWPDYHAVVSVIGWISVWSLAYRLRYHPLSCKFGEDSRYRKVLSWILWTAAIVQWIISCYLLGHIWRDLFPPRLDFPQRYDCVNSQMASGPGQSPCSANQLCSTPWLLTNPGWKGWEMDSESAGFFAQYDIASFMLALVFFFSTACFVSVPLITVVTRAYKIFRPGLHVERTMAGDLAHYDSEIGGPVVAGAVAAVATLCIGAVLIGHTPAAWNLVNREGSIAYDLECTAVHVIASPWRQYMDIELGRVLRIVRMWFNV